MKSYSQLLFATAGIPLSTEPRNSENGIAQVKNLGLDAMELEFVRSINISEKKAPDIKQAAKDHHVALTCHAPYYINLNAQEKNKMQASMYRIEKSAKILAACGGWSVCFHPGYYLKQDPNQVYEIMKERIQQVRNNLEDVDVWIRPETTGKNTQFGTFEELLQISAETPGVMPVVDFSHIHARTNGKFNTKEEFTHILERVEYHLGREGLDNMHIHVSGINYGEKGEKNHLILEESDMNYQELCTVWKDFAIKGIVVCESPNIEQDALLLKKTFYR